MSKVKSTPSETGNKVSSGQLPLPFIKLERFDFDTFLPGNNAELIHYLKSIVDGVEKKNIYLWGPTGCGKSHLLNAVCNRASEGNKNPAYIPLTNMAEFSTEILQGLEQFDLVCVDGLDNIAGQKEWEIALFDLFNRLRECGRPLIMAAEKSPQLSGIRMQDLHSRLAWDLVYHITPMSDLLCVEALKIRAKLRGFEMNDDVAEYLLKRVPRDVHSLFDLLDLLDERSLAAGKKLTIPFIKQFLV